MWSRSKEVAGNGGKMGEGFGSVQKATKKPKRRADTKKASETPQKSPKTVETG